MRRNPAFAKLISAFFVLGLIIQTPVAIQASELRRTPLVLAVKNSKESVVNIHGHKTMTADENGNETATPRRVNGMGTGVIIDERGYVITNHHVIDGVRRIKVTLADRRTTEARLVAHDRQTDLAIIKIQTQEKLPVLRIGTSSDLMECEPVIAIGNAYGYHHTVTRGVISALGRSVQVTDSQRYNNLIQTDASINPGNSGGPLLNADGELIGINVAVRVGAQNIGFAIPVDEVMEVAARLLKTETTTGTWHGLVGECVSDEGSRRFIVHSVRHGSPAEVVGIKAGDVVTDVGSLHIERGLDVERALLGVNPGETVPVRVLRDEQTTELAMRVEAMRPQRLEDRNDPWELLGLELSPVGADNLKAVSSRYRGGLQVARVRANSPAATQGIKPGDILVGMHVWETVSLDNLDYVIRNTDPNKDNPVSFYIVRGETTYEGRIPIQLR
ncbi:MAG: trypsin-like peptidase domain-containing protein [Planctomycetales bacterium]|nr:trypsin-like peptidase domain-containing protein [Planctomycetales bacterium]